MKTKITATATFEKIRQIILNEHIHSPKSENSTRRRHLAIRHEQCKIWFS